MRSLIFLIYKQKYNFMKTKKYNEFVNEEIQLIDENKAVKIIASLGKHAITAIAAYLVQNPEVIGNLFNTLKDMGDKKVNSEISKL